MQTRSKGAKLEEEVDVAPYRTPPYSEIDPTSPSKCDTNDAARLGEENGNEGEEEDYDDDEEYDTEEEEEETPEDKDVCLPINTISSPIRIYQCLRRPEWVAYHICLWEQSKNTEQLQDIHPASPLDSSIYIPTHAIYIIVGDCIIHNPYGSVLLFSTLDNFGTPNEGYTPIIGFYYNCSRAGIVWSLHEFFDGMCNEGICQLYEKVRMEDRIRFSKVYGVMSEIVNREMGEVEEGRRVFRNVAGRNRAAATRWRSPVLVGER
ncbi:hypothetical protein EJ08DRAFT_702092 [Tothia fuscella]|uniref:Uncharacterized protein n=1 Tax=Tothia fuscella TaxID=1048955 RepID=A0A9P4NH64_9PEZI|nr:hypothetical protein EJ08DRAFT_702092 [Tothia fuscella]